MDASRLERAARAVVDDFPFLTMRDAMKRAQASGSERVPCFLSREHLEALEALRAALDAAQEPAPAQVVEVVARAVRETALVNFNTPQEYDVACAQRAACEMAALNYIDAHSPGGA